MNEKTDETYYLKQKQLKNYNKISFWKMLEMLYLLTSC